MSESLRVLITGATGFVGGHLIRVFDEEMPVALEVFGTAYPEFPRLSGNRFFRLDLRSEKDVIRTIKDVRPDWICHLAAISNVGRSWHMRATTVETNVLGTHNLLEAVRQAAPAARLLFVSSSDVYGYGVSGVEGLKEESPLHIVSPYAFSKAAGEMLCGFYEEIENIDIVVARPFPHTGPGQAEDFVCSDWARQVAQIERDDVTQVLRIGNLDLCRDFCDVRDVARAYMLLLRKGRRGESYNICSGKSMALRDILDFLVREAAGNIPISVELDPGKVRKIDMARQLGNHQKISEETGWLPRISMDQTLRDLLDYWRDRLRPNDNITLTPPSSRTKGKARSKIL